MIHTGFVHLLLQKTFRTGHPDLTREEPRNTILVGHSFGGDIVSLQKVTASMVDPRLPLPPWI